MRRIGKISSALSKGLIRDKNQFSLLASMEGRWIRVGEVNTHYLVGGEGSPLVIIHGGGSGAEEEWAPNLPSLVQHYRLYAPDLVGYGRTDKPSLDYDLPVLSSFFEDFMNALDLKRASLLGHSLGGGAALAYALKHPERVQKLVLVDSVGFGEGGTLLGYLLILLFILRAKLRRDEVYPCLVRNRALYTALPVNELRELVTPTLIVWGQWDHYLSLKLAQKGHGLIKNSRLCVFKGCRHVPQRERPEEFNRLVLEFLGEK